MSINRLQDLGQAHYAGVPFRVRSESLTEGGRKKVLHEYPNRNTRFVEDLGLLPPKFKIEAFVHGSNWLDNARRLEEALNSPEPAPLSMPTLGFYGLIFSTTYTKDSTQTAVGEITFSIEFVFGQDTSAPFIDPVTEQDVYQNADDIRNRTKELFEGIDGTRSIWLNLSDSLGLISTANDLEGLTRGVIDIVARNVDNDLLSEVLKISSRIRLNASSLIRSGVLIGDELFNIDPVAIGFFQQLSVSLPTNGAAFNSMIELSSSLGSNDFFENEDINGDDIINDNISEDNTRIPLWEETTQQRINRNINRWNLVQSYRLMCLIIAYEQAIGIIYRTENEIQEVRIRLELIYNQIIINDSEKDISIQNDEELKIYIENLRDAVYNILDQKKQEVYKLTTQEVYKQNALILAYQLYAEEFTDDVQIFNRAIDLRNLNPELPSTELNGEITVFEV